MRRFIAATLAAFTLLLIAPAPAAAQDGTLVVNTNLSADPGTLLEIGRIPVRTDLAGPLCTWRLTVTNQWSPHLGNDLIVRSGGSEFTVTGIEDVAGKVTVNSGTAYLTDEIVVLMKMGPDGVFSGRLELVIDYASCAPEPTTTTTTTEPPAVEPTTPTTGATTTESATTAAPATTSGPTTTEDVAPLGPTLPVTGTGFTLSLFASGTALLLVGVALVLRTRTAL